MIHTDFNWTEPLNILLLTAALALLVLQIALLYTRHRQSGGRQSGGRQSGGRQPGGRHSGGRHPGGRMGIRLFLNVLLWSSVVAWILDPYFKSNAGSNTGLLIAENVPSPVVRHIRDSLAGAEVIKADEVSNRPMDTLVIVGQELDETVLASIRQLRNMPVLHWKPWFKQGRLHDLHWKGILRKGEMQRIEGSIQRSGKKTLQVRYADKTLDSVALNAGDRNFSLAFPTFSEGRTTVTLALDGQTIDTLRYFTQPEQKLTIRFLLDNPDFETRNLATWLGKQGHAVLYGATLSKNIRSELNINRATEPDLIVTGAANAADANVKKALNAGKSMLFMQLNDPAMEIRSINHALGTSFQPVKISNEESVPISPSLRALPFRFEPHSFQMRVPHYPVAMERATGKIAVCLLNETFPMQLSGDSIAYGKVWNEILAYTRPAQKSVIAWEAPVFVNVPVTMHLNNFQGVPWSLTLGQDTILTTVSALNDRSAAATFLPNKSGWLTLHDSLEAELYVQDYSPLRYAARMQHFIQSTQKTNPAANPDYDAISTRKLPVWAWFTWLMLCLAALWIEPKLG
ncbi:hypothetical protein SAMN05216327_11510 [Dyadobacter sp. SG02]|uniref:hypothetical protein n=1 Tax=Dyadobacter sp. SG02 TaxID=1855291 RepID=UPI0008CA7B93|nr:hypothetical protein [Dyadobacter sp. SG02]SEJ64768.1 hypothetical protein SAMN05216327_11510 [Dyadobacter sp. SG02]